MSNPIIKYQELISLNNKLKKLNQDVLKTLNSVPLIPFSPPYHTRIIFKDGFEWKLSWGGANHRFYELFEGETILVSSQGLIGLDILEKTLNKIDYDSSYHGGIIKFDKW